MTDWSRLPVLRDDKLILEDTSASPIPGSIVPCLLCFKPYLMRPYMGVPDQICPECWETYKDAARVICFKCKVTICRLMPKVLDNGYYIRPRSVLHSDACNICKEGLKESTVVEIEQWNKTVRPGKIIVPMSQRKYR